MRTLVRLTMCIALVAIATACVPIGVKGTSLPYASNGAPAAITQMR
jgi:hypothetical protein